EGRIAQLIASETWLNENGICDRTFDLITRPKVITPQGKTRLFTKRSIAQAASGNRQKCIDKAARRRRLIA
ncbi:regulator, partial [Klebsiella pneumoniae]|nr:regulator [Klebsiella pneumoniae]